MVDKVKLNKIFNYDKNKVNKTVNIRALNFLKDKGLINNETYLYAKKQINKNLHI